MGKLFVPGQPNPFVPQKPKSLIVSVCKHGVSDSWATKGILEDLSQSEPFEIIARGVDPNGKVQETPEGTRGVELTIDDMRKAVLVLIHSSNRYVFRERFGHAFDSALETAGILYERDGRECQHLHKNTDAAKKHIVDCCKTYIDLLNASLHRNPAGEVLLPRAFDLATEADAEWHLKKDKKIERKHLRGKHRKNGSRRNGQ